MILCQLAAGDLGCTRQGPNESQNMKTYLILKGHLKKKQTATISQPLPARMGEEISKDYLQDSSHIFK